MKELFINGSLVEVSDEVYAEYMRSIWREKKRRASEWRCRDGKGIRCKGKCEMCPYYKAGNVRQSSSLSLDYLAEEVDDPYDIEDLSADVEEIVAYSILRKDVQAVMAQLSERDQIVLRLVVSGASEKRIGDALGLSKSGGRKAKLAALKRVAPMLEKYRGYLEE